MTRRLLWLTCAAALAVSGTRLHAQFSPNPAYDGRVVIPRIKYHIRPDPGGCQGPDAPDGGGWAHHYPMASQGLMKASVELTNIDGVVDSTVILTVTDSAIMKYPIVMLTEPGCWDPTETEVRALRGYLRKGGFLIVDDPTFGNGSNESNLELAIERFTTWMGRVLPEGRFVRIPGSDPLFSIFFDVNVQGMTDDYIGSRPEFHGIYEDNDPTKRLMVVANYRTSISQMWRYAGGLGSGLGTGSTALAYKLGLNYVIYGLSH